MYLQKYSTDKQIKTLQAAEYANALLQKKTGEGEQDEIICM